MRYRNIKGWVIGVPAGHGAAKDDCLSGLNQVPDTSNSCRAVRSRRSRAHADNLFPDCLAARSSSSWSSFIIRIRIESSCIRFSVGFLLGFFIGPL